MNGLNSLVQSLLNEVLFKICWNTSHVTGACSVNCTSLYSIHLCDWQPVKQLCIRSEGYCQYHPSCIVLYSLEFVGGQLWTGAPFSSKLQ